MSVDRFRLCRSWLFIAGGDETALRSAGESGADVLIQELEDSVPSHARPAARALTTGALEAFRAAGAVSAVRVNPLATGGLDDLEEVMRAAPEVIMLSKVDCPDHVRELDEEVGRLERAYGIDPGHTALVPNVESALGVTNTPEICTTSPRTVACLLASEDLSADLGAVRDRDGIELSYARARFHLECVAAGAISIDCPYTWSDGDGLRAETRHARRLGYTAKCTAFAEHALVINQVLTPSPEEIERATALVEAFEAARSGATALIDHADRRIELPIYLNAKRLLERANALQRRSERSAIC